ncbi:leucine-rich repeat protein [uncultured Proteiniphilum sp.]|uniref:leucine-rich repeat protein n=1 Tax=uncultured Proteiniphilum sp. TaxID=497637 RepID=UPI0026074052|nr:leucine-rich repeat protein [uncultured Proteiniphilum sp.]
MDASEIYVPKGITAIGATSLSGAANLVTLNLPSTLTEIREAAFNGCTGLINFYIKAILPPSFVMPEYIGGFSTQAKVPATSYNAYRAAPT